MHEIGMFTLQVLVLTTMLTGLVGMVIPIIPGLTIIWAAALLYGLVTGFHWPSVVLFVIMTVWMVAGNLLDNFLMGAGAKEKGASWWAIGAAMLASIIGSLVWPPFGGIVLALVALFAVELIRIRNLRSAWDTTTHMAFGWGWSLVGRFLVGLQMIGLWVIWLVLYW